MSDIYLPPKVNDEFVFNGEFITEYRADHPGRLWLHESVTRCKDCKHWTNGRCWGIPFCGDDASYIETEEHDYCSYGERSESETKV